MRTLEKKEKGFNWEPLAKATPIILILLCFAFFIIVPGICQYLGGNG